MSQSASVDDSIEIESDSSDSDGGRQSLDEGLQQVRENVTEQLKKIDDDGEQIKRIVGHAIVGDRTDSDVSMDLRQEITSHINEIHSSNGAVSVNEIILALWAELYRVSEMVTGGTEDNGEGEVSGTDDSEGTTVENDPKDNSQSDLAFADSGSTPETGPDGETSPTETDPAFQ